VNGEPERRLQDLLLLHPHPERQEQARHMTRELPRQLHTSALHEEVDDGEVEGGAARRRHRLGPGTGKVDAMALAPKDHGERTATGDIPVDEENRGHLARGTASHVPRSCVDRQRLVRASRGRLPAA
jgi:hypothetical protein